MSKILFTIRPHSIIDVITNSSTELFVGKAQSKEEIIELIKEVYPNYLDEYDEIKSINDITPSELDNYFWYACSPHVWPANKWQYPILPGFTFEELYEPKEKAWNNELQYCLKNNYPGSTKPLYRKFVTVDNFEEIKNKLDPKRELYFLYSINDNPDWDMQEKLEEFMTRHHMG